MNVEIRPVRTKSDLRKFIKLPFRLYKDDANWVPPLIYERKRFLNRSKNPFFDHAEAEYFLAEHDGKVVGRIAACVDERYEEFQGKPDGSFGFFDAVNDTEVACALLDEASTWLKARDRERMLGPMDFTTNDECGLLIEGYGMSPYILMPYHHSYYKDLLEEQGLTKSIDLLQWKLHHKTIDFLPVLEELAEKSESEHGIKIRPLNMDDFEAEIGRFFDFYNSAWEKNWGFVPLTEAELKYHAKDLKQILEPKIALFAERDGETLGGALSLPNINEILPRMKGRLLPFGWLKFLRGKSKITGLRVFALGVKPEHQHTGVAAALYVKIRDGGYSVGIDQGEMGWILETNTAMNKAMEAMNGEVVKRYRIFEKEL